MFGSIVDTLRNLDRSIKGLISDMNVDERTWVLSQATKFDTRAQAEAALQVVMSDHWEKV